MMHQVENENKKSDPSPKGEHTTGVFHQWGSDLFDNEKYFFQINLRSPSVNRSWERNRILNVFKPANELKNPFNSKPIS